MCRLPQTKKISHTSDVHNFLNSCIINTDLTLLQSPKTTALNLCLPNKELQFQSLATSTFSSCKVSRIELWIVSLLNKWWAKCWLSIQKKSVEIWNVICQTLISHQTTPLYPYLPNIGLQFQSFVSMFNSCKTQISNTSDHHNHLNSYTIDTNYFTLIQPNQPTALNPFPPNIGLQHQTLVSTFYSCKTWPSLIMCAICTNKNLNTPDHLNGLLKYHQHWLHNLSITSNYRY